VGLNANHVMNQFEKKNVGENLHYVKDVKTQLIMGYHGID
jgi:hypothetical protein